MIRRKNKKETLDAQFINEMHSEIHTTPQNFMIYLIGNKQSFDLSRDALFY